MASIPYQAKDCHFSQDKGTGDPDPALVEQFYPKVKQEIVKGDYLRRKWQPLCGPRFYALIKAIRAYCSYAIKEGEAECYPSEETLARACGVTRRTIINWLARVKEGEGQELPGLRVGDFCHPRHGKALQQFLRIVPKLRYDPVGQRSVKGTHRYFIRMDDPPVPEDVPLIWAKAREMAVQYLERQAQEQEHDARRMDAEAKATRASSSCPTDCTYNNAQNLHSQQCEKNAHTRLFLTPQFNTDTPRSTQEEESAAQAIRSTQNAPSQQTNEEEDESAGPTAYRPPVPGAGWIE